MTLRLGVAGSRLLTTERHADAVRQGLVWCGKLLGRDTVLVHGDCPPAARMLDGVLIHTDGADRLARDQWLRWGLPHEPHPADWGRLGLKAGPIRNEEMAAAGADIWMVWPHPDPRERSAGTWDMVGRCHAHGITVLSGWDLLPVLTVPDLPPAPAYAGPMPHAEAIAAARS